MSNSSCIDRDKLFQIFPDSKVARQYAIDKTWYLPVFYRFTREKCQKRYDTNLRYEYFSQIF